MDIKNFISDFFGFTQDIYSPEGQKYSDLLNICETKLNNYVEKVNQLEKLNEKQYNELDIISKQYLDCVNNYEESEQSKYWNSKYPKSNISYVGRTWGTSKDMIKIDVRLLVTPKDFMIHDILAKNKLYLKDNNNDVDATIIKIYKWIKNNFYKYAFDQDNYGVSEFWEFPFEILERKRLKGRVAVDCDSWANFQASFYIASGVPEWKVRIVIGGCQLGGHSTVYVHSDETNKFHHLNSTYGNNWNTFTKIKDYPTTDDAETTDKLGIKNVWFSFNNLWAWNKFSSEAKENYKEKHGDELFIIK